MYYRLHKATGRQSVKIFRDEHGRHFCEHCEAYELLNALLGCSAQHGPKRGWAADELQGRLRRRVRRPRGSRTEEAAGATDRGSCDRGSREDAPAPGAGPSGGGSADGQDAPTLISGRP
mmetsp:Transcript_68342/g.203329  ORF Transcript_68342/g.203329 Transcript_68342/m.203329 type:complete len:119 (-) Transcript_68342:111-467(-)